MTTHNRRAAMARQRRVLVTTAVAAPLDKGYFEQAFLDGFTPGALNPLTVDGTTYGLRNDLAPTVTWYNQSLMDEFGYDVPATWEEYEALGVKVAAEHPGYIIGTVGDSFTPEIFFWAAKAPGNVGGGTWFISRHSANLENAKTFLEWVTSDPAYQVDVAQGLPAYKEVGDLWLAKQAETGFFTDSFADNVSTAAGQVWDGWGFPKFSQEAVWAKTIIPELAAGKSLVDLLPAWETAIKNEAQVNGYQVS